MTSPSGKRTGILKVNRENSASYIVKKFLKISIEKVWNKERQVAANAAKRHPVKLPVPEKGNPRSPHRGPCPGRPIHGSTDVATTSGAGKKVIRYPPSKDKVNTTESHIEEVPDTEEPVKPALKYILQWTKPNFFFSQSFGQQGFIDRNCLYTNCYVTNDSNYLRDYTKFDVIAFYGPHLVQQKKYSSKRALPQKRSPHQKYVFVSIESSAYYPVCKDYFDGFFNWTWTFKTDSDSRWGYLVVRDMDGKVLGPNTEMHWIKHEDMLSPPDELKSILRGKKKAAACEDYVTEKLTRALLNNAVPIVYGGANYSRFMPDGAYLNARELGVSTLAAKMNELMNDFDQYADYFRWTNHYRYENMNTEKDTNNYCAICTILNDEKKVKQNKIYKDFRKWWNNPNTCKE
ncbi:glycosyltransferase family 10 (fucosyltransferase) c-term domain-containing protein [Phthorimaea operculella]|nr:glycosyltransferase family 10 (fucosyltransferase) c-term domain-containing protein [Phthorimaea operculella]